MAETHFLYDPETERRLELLRRIEERISNVPTRENVIFKKFLISAIKTKKPRRMKPVKLKGGAKLLGRKTLSVKKSMRLAGDKKEFFPNLSGGLFDKIMSYTKHPRIGRIFCNGPGHNVVIEYDGKRFESGLVFRGYKEMNEFMLKLVKKQEEQFKPIVDFNIPGFRFHGIFGSDYVAPKFIFKRI